MQANQNPQEFVMQYMNNSSNDVIQRVFMQAKQYGVPDQVLQQVQNMRNK